jgi:hypothetical protein
VIGLAPFAERFRAEGFIAIAFDDLAEAILSGDGAHRSGHDPVRRRG